MMAVGFELVDGSGDGPILASCRAARAFSRSSVVAPLNVHECDDVAPDDAVLHSAGALVHTQRSFHLFIIVFAGELVQFISLSGSC